MAKIMIDHHNKRVYRTRPPFPYAELVRGLLIVAGVLVVLWLAL